MLLAACTEPVPERNSVHSAVSQPRSPLAPRTPLERITDAADARIRRLQPKVEEAIQLCMRRRGFTYVPFDTLGAAQPSETETFSDRRFRSRFGYGISTMLRDESAAESQTEGDPNIPIRTSLSHQRLEAYRVAMWGNKKNSRTVKNEAGQVVYRMFPQSCVTRANSAVHGSQVQVVRALVSLEELREKLSQHIRSDPRVAAVNREWSQCMSEEGYSFGVLTDIQRLLQNRFARLYEAAQQPLGGEPHLSMGDQRLENLQNLERAIAQQDWHCRTKTHMENVIHTVRTRYETHFVATHRRLLRRAYR